MLSALLLAVVLTADDSPPPPSSSELPTHFAMYVTLLEPLVVAPGAGVISGAPLGVLGRVGAVLGGRHALLVGVSFATQFDGPGGGTTLTFMPTYRFFFRPLAANSLSPYVQAELFVGYAYASTGGAGASTVPFGLGGSFGGEYLVGRSFGITAGLGARLVHSETAFAGTVGAKATGFGLYASAGLALHF